MPGPWSYETRTERTARLARAQAQPKDYGSQLDSFLSDRLSKIGIDPGVLASEPSAPAQRATAPSSAPSDGGILRNTLTQAAGFKRQAIADNPGGDSGGGFLSDFASNVKDVAAGALHTGLSVAAKPFELSSEYGSPIFAALTGESRAGRHPILDANGQPTGQFYRDKPDFRDMGASLLGLVTNPVSEYQRGQGAVNERINNPQVQQDFVGRGALRTFSDPLQVGIAALSGGSTALAAPAFNIATEGATQYAQDLPGWRNLSPDVQQALILAGSVIAAKKGPAIARKAAEVTGLKDAYQMGAVPGAAMVKADLPVEMRKVVTQAERDLKSIHKAGIYEKADWQVPTDPAEVLDRAASWYEGRSQMPVGLKPNERVKLEQYTAARDQLAASTPEPVVTPPPDTAAGSAPEVATPESAPPLAPASNGGNVPPPDSAPPGPPEPPSGGITPGGQEPLPTVQVGPFTLPDITPTPLNRVDTAMNAVKRTLDIGVEEDPMATPAMRARKQAQPVIDAQASRLGAIAQTLVDQAFNRDAKGRITDLVGNPTVQDVAARLPEFAPSLTPEQMRVMEQLRAEVQPYHDLLTKVGVDVNSRADVVDGGFYLPRGRADVEGADLPVKVGSGRSGGVGGRKGFEKGAVFDTQAQGIDAGYQYAPLEEALQSYARDAGNRIIDQHVANYFRNLTDENGVPVGQTPHARVLAQNPAIANQVEGLRKSLDSMRGTVGRLSDRQQAAIDQFLNSPAPDLEELKAALDQRVGLNAVGKAGPNYGKNVTELRQAIRDVRGKVDALMPEWKRALDRARQTPREQGTIGIAQLNGMTFPDVVANAANKYLAAERPPSGQGAVVLHTINGVNNLLRGLRASVDVSFMGIQGLLGAARDPIGYGKAMAVAWKAMADPQALGKYLIEYDRRALEKGLPTSKQLISNGLHIGGADTEFAAGKGLPLIGDAIQHGSVPKVGLNPVRGSNRMFGYFGDTMRLEFARTAFENAKRGGFDMTDAANVRAVTNAANLATGWSPNTFGGSVGQLAEFAPRFLQSQIELITKAATDGSITGNEARIALSRLVGSGVLLTVAANEASGRPVDYRELFDPNSPNFMRFRVAGQDVSLFGPWDSLTKAVVNVAHGDVNYLARSKASPTLGLAWDLLSGSTFTGEDASLKSPGYVVRQLLPFSLQDIASQSPMQTTVGMTGLKSSPLSPTETMDQIAQAKYGKGFYDLLSSQQAELKAAHPDTWQRMVERGNSNRQKYEAIKADFTTQQSASDAQLLSGKLTREKWLSQLDDRKTQLAGAQLAIYGKDKPITNPRNASERYAQILQRNQDETGAINWDAVDAEVANLKPEDQAWIQDRQGLGNTPVVTAYKKAADLRSKYFDLPKYKGFTGSEAQQIDALWTQLRANVRVPNTGPMLAELKKLNASGTIDPKVYSGVRRRILGVLRTTKDRERFVKANPAMTTFFGGNGKGGPLTASEAQQLQGAA